MSLYLFGPDDDSDYRVFIEAPNAAAAKAKAAQYCAEQRRLEAERNKWFARTARLQAERLAAGTPSPNPEVEGLRQFLARKRVWEERGAPPPGPTGPRKLGKPTLIESGVYTVEPWSE